MIKDIDPDRLKMINSLQGLLDDNPTQVIDYDRYYTTSQLVEATGSSRAKIQRMLKNNQIIAVKQPSDRSNHFPSWQVVKGKFLPFIGEVLDALDLTGREALNAILSPIPNEDDRNIINLLYDKDYDAALAVAKHEAHYRKLTSSQSGTGSLFDTDCKFSYKPENTGNV